MKLSFVIPAYNEEAYLGRCLESVLKEVGSRREEIEVIVVNNASSDRTEEVARSFPGVKVVYEPVKGLAQARRAGMAAALGELVANIDADTILPDGWLARVIDKFSSDPKLVAYSGPHVFYDASKTVRFFSRIFYLAAYAIQLFNRLFFGVGMLQGGNFIFRKAAFEKVGGYDPQFVFWGEDTDVARRLSKVGKVEFSLRLPIFASARRLEGNGMIKTAGGYVVNFFWTLIFKKPFHRAYTDIRRR